MSLAVMLVILALILFVPAGRIDWLRGWLFFLVFTAATAIAIIYLWRVNPEIFKARRTIHKGTKGWDLALLAVLLPAMVAAIPVAALDDGRFHWSQAGWWVVGVGYVLFLSGYTLMTRAQAVNRFFEPGVRIQTDRGHHVIESGPYRFVRHPGYAAAILLFFGLGLALGSYWALVPAALAAITLILRTVWEDRTLHDELPGYRDYARKVRYRLIPGIW
jgi:protein-S-isoprenylcysteine O-methyltransferase Ste14